MERDYVGAMCPFSLDALAVLLFAQAIRDHNSADSRKRVDRQNCSYTPQHRVIQGYHEMPASYPIKQPAGNGRR